MLALLLLAACIEPAVRAPVDRPGAALDDCPDLQPQYEDEDGDGVGVWVPDGHADEACPGAPGWSDTPGDCDDADPTVHVGAEDVCGDAVDHDCIPGCAPTAILAAEEALWTSHAPTWFGISLAIADVTGDGHAEVLVGGNSALALYTAPLTAASPAKTWELGATAVAAVGDLDGDGAEEIAVGKTDYRYCTGACDWDSYGGVWLIDGNLDAIDYEPHIGRGGWGQDFGAAVARGGDLDGDGRSEVLVGSPGAGLARSHHHDGAVAVEIVGETEEFGSVIAGGSDLDGDGASDVVIASYDSVTLFRGPLQASVAEADADAWLVHGGRGSLGVGDLDGDGVEDLSVVVAWQDASLPCTVAVYGGPLEGSVGQEAEIACVLLAEGYVRSHLITDLDGDGGQDLLVAEPEAPLARRGAVHALLGPVQGTLIAVDEADRRWVSDTPEARLGWSLATGDLDADGLLDLLVGAPRIDLDGEGHGAVHHVLWEE